MLREPYPQNDGNKAIVTNGAITGLIVTFILVVFRPFGFSEAPLEEALYFAIIFGLISFAVIIAYEFFLKYVVKIKRDHPKWTFWKWLVSNLGILAGITTANYFFTVYTYGLPHSARHFLGILYSALSIGVFPITLFGLLIVIRRSRNNDKIAAAIHLQEKVDKENQQPNLVRIPIHQSDQYFEVDTHQIICIEAMQNYIQVYYHQGEEIVKKILRNTLSKTEQALSGTDIQRSHRSFLVNTARIEQISGNAQGLKLEVNPSPGFWVPVSRKYIPAFKK